jgi:hypothetical protein
MSTQRRANRTAPAIENDCAADRFRWFRGCTERTRISIPEARTGSALASQITPHFMAPLVSIVWLAWAWLISSDGLSQELTDHHPIDEDLSPGAPRWVATDSLLSDYCFETFAGIGSLSGSPPRNGSGDRRLKLWQATRRSSSLHIPNVPVRARLYPTLPQAPAGIVHWAERHDGKRDLYFQHAA